MQVEFVAVRRRRRPALLVGAVLVGTALVVATLASSGVVPATEAAGAVPDVVTPPHAVTPVPPPTAAAPAHQPTAPPVPTIPPIPEGRQALVATLEGLLAAPGIDGALAVSVADEHGRVLIDRGGDLPLLPASTQKLITAAAALEALGPDHRFRTSLHATAIAQDGVLRGDLVLVGSGDPALASPVYGELVYPARPRTPLERLADAVVTLGITHVEGTVVGDARAYPTSPEADGWYPRYFHDLDARFVSSLTAEAGLSVQYDEDADDLTIELAREPARNAAVVLRDLLLERGVTITGEPREGSGPPSGTFVLSEVDSPPVADLLRHTVQRSDNHMADTLLHAVALETVGEAGWSAGDRAVREALGDLDLEWDGVTLADGSGLSRANRSSSGFLVALDRAMYDSEYADTWSDLMAVAGSRGTLKRRLVGTPAAGRFTGKTGTLDDVRAIAGTVHGDDGRRYHLAVVGNDLVDGDSRSNTRALMDNLALALAADLAGCTETTVPHDPTVRAEPPPRTWACPGAA